MNSREFYEKLSVITLEIALRIKARNPEYSEMKCAEMAKQAVLNQIRSIK